MTRARTTTLSVLATALAVWPASARAQVSGYAEIEQPQAGSAVSGVVSLIGTADHPWFQSYDLAFAYADNPTQTWFALGEAVDTPVRNGRLGIWDTSGISDGDYTLRLRVWLTDGSLLVGLAEGVRVRNYHAAETPTPAPTSFLTPTPQPPTPTPTPWPAATAEREDGGMAQASGALAAGVLSGAGGLALLAIYSLARGPFRNRWANLRARWSRTRPAFRRRV